LREDDEEVGSPESFQARVRAKAYERFVFGPSRGLDCLWINCAEPDARQGPLVELVDGLPAVGATGLVFGLAALPESCKLVAKRCVLVFAVLVNNG
jgi:hypothetical protein